MTTLNNRPAQKLTGADLINRVKELGDVSKTDLVLTCGYVRAYQEDGTPIPAFAEFYEALLDAKGLTDEDIQKMPDTQEEDEVILVNGKTIEDFHNAVVDSIGETRKLLPYNMPVVDKVCVITQLAALLTHHQRMVQDLEQEGADTKSWMDDIEKLDTCIRLMLSIYLGEDDHWYRDLETSPKVENKGETTVGLQVFTDVVKKANALQAEVDQLKQQLGECKAKKGGLLHWLFPATF